MNHDMREVLDLTAHFQTEAEKILRYEQNPFVEGDSIAEHLARAARLLTYLTPGLKEEFPEEPSLVGDIFVCLMVHDDDEIIEGFDIPTAIKNHDVKNDEEISAFAEAVSTLSNERQNFLVSTFSSFRNKSSLAAKIAKALDNITGNQLVIEQKIGLINPDSARFCIEYAQKVTGVSKVIDELVAAQIQQVVEGREQLKVNEQEILKISGVSNLPDASKIKELLGVDVMDHVLDKSKVYTSLSEL
jgi:5'-deoxynucleotidase YfbR-like HD superfamily hydrolase